MRISFLGEPEGNGAALLKGTIARVLGAEDVGAKAYLSKIQYASEASVRVAVIMDCQVPAKLLAQHLAKACQPLAAIDILFFESLSDLLIERLKQSVVPFFPPARQDNKLFLINVHLRRGRNTDMPPNLAGAYVPAFVSALNWDAGAHHVVRHLTGLGYEFVDIADRKIHQLDPLRWRTYVKDAWSDVESHFPSQEDVVAALPYGRVFFGPFAGYESERR